MQQSTKAHGPAPPNPFLGQAPTPTQLTALTQQWLESWQHAGALASGSLSAATIACDSRRLWKFWFTDTAQSMDRYMRSPAFLDLMICNLKAMTRAAAFLPMFGIR